MTSDDKIRDKKDTSMILTEKQQQLQHYHQEKLTNINILQVEKKQTKKIENQGEKQIRVLENRVEN